MKPNQVILQSFVAGLVFLGRRIAPPSLIRSVVTSITIIMFAITKALMSQQISHTKKTSKLKQIKQLVWIICLAGTIFAVNILQLNVIVWGFICYGKEYNRSPPSTHKFSLLLSITGLTLFFFICIFMYKNCFKQHFQTKVRCIILSINHIINCISHLIHLNVFIFGQDTGNVGMAGFHIIMIILNLSLVFVFAKASFSVSKLNDIWSLEKMASKELCLIPNLLFTIVFLSFFLFVLGFVLQSFGDPYYA